MRSAPSAFVRQYLGCALSLAVWLAPVWGATLEQLTLAGMISKSTAIVHGRITGSSTAARGSVVYTHYQVNVLEQWKGSTQSTADVQVPGGVANGIRQTYPGAPQLTVGRAYVLFLWTSSKSVTYTIGFTQGVFSLPKDASGQVVAVQAPTTETMLDPVTGRVVNSQPISMPFAQLVSQITAGVAAQAAGASTK